MIDLYNVIGEIFKKNPNILYGISNIDFSEYKSYYKLCNQKRSLCLKTLHRKHSCGLCMVSCPIGI